MILLVFDEASQVGLAHALMIGTSIGKSGASGGGSQSLAPIVESEIERHRICLDVECLCACQTF